MKVKIIFLAAALLAATTISADPIQVPVKSVPPAYPQDGGPARTPAATPVFYLDGYTLTASSYTIGSTVELKDEDDTIVFSTYVYMEGDIDLPTDLAGTYTLEVQRGSMTFIGEIEL